MKIPSLSKQLSQSSKRKRSRGRPKAKYIKYKPKKGEEQKNWEVEAIVNERIRLSPWDCQDKSKEQSSNVDNRESVMPYKLVRQFEIAWKPESQDKKWKNSWQPQQNIPDYLRLDYLLMKRKQIKNIGKLNKLTEKIIRKETLQNSVQNTQTKLISKPLKMTRAQKRSSIKKIISKKDGQKFTETNYKDKEWFTYFSKTQDFHELIERFLKGQENQKIQTIQKHENIKNEKLSTLKSQQEPLLLYQGNEINQESNNSQPTNLKTDYLDILVQRHDMPKNSCEIFIKEIEYNNKQNQVDSFRLVLYDNSVTYVSEADLTRYFPYAYEKLLINQINISIRQAEQSISTIQHNQIAQRNIISMGELLGLEKSDFSYSDPSDPKRMNKSDSIFSRMFFLFGNLDIFSNYGDRQSNYFQQIGEEQNYHCKNQKLIRNQIEGYFTYIKESAQQHEIIDIESSFRGGTLFRKEKQNNFIQQTSCIKLFKNSKTSDTSLKNHEKNQTISAIEKKENRFQALKKEKKNQNFTQKYVQKQPFSDKKTIEFLKLSNMKQFQPATNNKEDTKSEIDLEIQPRQNNLKQQVSKSQKQQFEINKLFQDMSEFSREQDDFYDSDDSQCG